MGTSSSDINEYREVGSINPSADQKNQVALKVSRLAPYDTFEEPAMRIIRDKHEIERVYLQMVNEARTEILLLLPSTNAYIREVDIGIIEALRVAANRHVVVRMLTPDPSQREKIRRYNLGQEALPSGNLITIKSIREASVQNTVTILVIDRTGSLIIEQQDDKELDFTKAIGLATYSARGSTVKANIRFFERMWEEVEDSEKEQVLLEKESRSRKEAELLQDILAHDLRNFIQTIISNGELIRDEWDDLTSSERSNAINQILDATERSSQLIERAKKLGKIISQDFNLTPINLGDSLRMSIDLVSRVHRIGSINTDFTISEDFHVFADELLDEVFVNVLSNAVKHGMSYQSPVEIKVEEDERRDVIEQNEKVQKYWKVSITDQGKGIPDEIKSKIFTRYLETARGSGLGLSIVHALVFERYSGYVGVRNRVESDYRQGTVFKILLKQAPPIENL